jgi:hypothetical protein
VFPGVARTEFSRTVCGDEWLARSVEARPWSALSRLAQRTARDRERVIAARGRRVGAL